VTGAVVVPSTVRQVQLLSRDAPRHLHDLRRNATFRRLGLLVGFFDLIPLVDATLGAIFVAIATATVDFPSATIVWVAFIIVYQGVENSFIQPVVYGHALKVNPIVTILAVREARRCSGSSGAAGYPDRRGDPDPPARLVDAPAGG
jgi:hypothetical protein